MAKDDDGVACSNVLHSAAVSPCGGRDDDESSVDIYDGLDITPVHSVNPATKVTPARNNLNLFDEILIEEGVAKEASYNDLQAENERCQQQLQELMKKLQEIQEQNSTLQKENQSLKKNISALIKTARVEINRKDEEINNLQRRLSEVPVHQNAYTRTCFQASANNARNFERSKAKINAFRNSLPENNPKMGTKTKQTQPKDVSHFNPSWETENKKSYSERRNGMNISRPRPEEFHSDGVHSRLTNDDSPTDKEKGKREIRSNDCRYKTKAHQNGGSTADKLLDVHEKLHVNPEKSVRNGLWKDTKDLKIRDCPKTEKFPKQLMLKDKLLSKTEHSSTDRDEKAQNINQKDLKTHNKDDNSGGQKNRQSQRHQDPQRRSSKESSMPERNINAKSPQKLSKSCVEDRKRKDSNCRWSRDESEHVFRGRKLSPLQPSMSNRDHKRGHSKEDNKLESESIHSKSERHRTEEKRKNERESPREDQNLQNGRTDSKVTSQKITKETSKDNTRKVGNKSFLAEEFAKVGDDVEPQMSTKPRKNEDQSKSKDLKLSFMQTLNLTLSPAKKQGDEFKIVSKSIDDCDTEILGQKDMIVPADAVTMSKQAKSLSECNPNNCVQTVLEQILISEPSRKVRNEDVSETLDTEPSKTTSELQKMKYELVANTKVLPEAEITVEEADEILMVSSPGSPLDQGTFPDNVFNDLETVSSVDFDSFSVIDEINGTDSDSLMETEETGNFASEKVFKTPEKEITLPKPVPFQNTVEESKLSEDVPSANQKASDWKPSFLDKGDSLKTCKVLSPTLQVQDTQPVCADDDNSILSIDLNHMRYIPKIISPINSPIRPLAKALRMESLYKGPVKSYNIVSEGAVVCPTKNLSSDLNKENQKPLRTDHQILEMESQLSPSSDELEEGEIVSDEDEKPPIEKHSENGKRSRGKTSPDRSNLANSPHNQNAKATPSSEDTGKSPSKRKKSKEKSKTETIISAKEVTKTKTVNINCLEKIVHITAEPSTVHEIMQMLRAIRKQFRKNYMKLKIQFPIQHFHRIIDSAILNFTSLVKYLDFSKVCKTSKDLKLNLCEVIESKLKLIKKNSAIEHLFEQQQSEMKKKLWKLVDEQLDYLFDKIKKILLKLCKNIGNESNEAIVDTKTAKSPKCLTSHKTDRQKSKKPALNARTQKLEECALPKLMVGNQLSKKGYSDTKTDAAKNMTTKQTRSCSGNTKRSPAGVELSTGKSMQGMASALKAGKYEKGLQVVGDSQKSDLTCGPLTEQQMSGLTFNLVNDAQMGEMFKSLLQGSDLSEKNIDFTDENQWEFKTPIKHMPDSQTCEDEPAYETEESIPKETQTESRVLDGIKWPVVSPEREPSFLARLQMPIDPDILDESCMFDIPTSPALKKGEACISGRPKSLVSSILLEDLAVSLTIPSPLKSDSHLSFLKPDVLGSVPQDVLSAHLSEDAHLEEEDASEQDIHLALDSDNSSSKSSCSSSWANMPAPPGFQYCPSLPMQAVIMEKSNDHFIVKIRRAAPSTSPGFDQVSVANEPLTSLTEREDSEVMSQEKLDTLNSKSIPLEEATMSKRKMPDSESKMDDNIVKEQASDLLESVKEPLTCLKKDEAKQSEPHQDASSGAPGNVLESVEALFSNSKQEQLDNMSVPFQEPSSNTSQNQGPDLLVTHQTLHCGKHSVDNSGETSDLLDPPKELERPLESSKGPPNKISQSDDIPEVFELPQTETTRMVQKIASCGIVEHSPISPAIVPLEDEFSSKAHFSMCVDVTDEPPMENEVDSWDLTIEPTLNEEMRSLNKGNEECNTVDCCVADHPLDHNVSKADVYLTENLPDKSAKGENFETKINLNIDSPGAQISLDKESKKRKKETEERSSVKRQKKETCEQACKKTMKSSKKSKETVNTLSKKTASIQEKDASTSTSSLSPSSLYAKNIVKKKGEVIVSWTRNDDREILLECQKKGPSEKSFASLAARLNKSLNQVEERFKQLVKLFQMSHCS